METRLAYGAGANHPQAYKIWATRHKEPPLLEPTFYEEFIKPEHDLEDIAIGSKLFDVASGLSPKLHKVIEMRYRLGMTLKEVADAFGVCRQRAYQLECDALREIKRKTGSFK